MDPESKLESSVWLPVGAERLTKALRSRSQKRTMLTCFFDSCGPILIEFTEETIDSEAYIQTLRRLRERIRKKRPGMWQSGVDGQTDWEFVIQHDNASPHTSNMTLGYLFDQDLLAHPPYSPDLAPCDFFLFPYLKQCLQSVRHRTLAEVKAAVRREIKAIPAQEFEDALSKLPMHWHKCAEVNGEYFAGRGVVPTFDPHFDQDVDSSSESSEEDKN